MRVGAYGFKRKYAHMFVPDPRNGDFIWQDHATTGLRQLSPAEIAAFDRDGAVCLRGAVDTAMLDALTAVIDRIESGVGDTVLTLEGGQQVAYRADSMTFARNLVAVSEVVRDFIGGDLFQGLGHDLIGPDVRLYWDQAVYKKPEAKRAFPWHQDNGYTFTDPQTYITCWLALNDATVENGCVHVLPGLHRRGTFRHTVTDAGYAIAGSDDPEVEARSLAMPAQAGDMIVFSSLTPHKTGPNLSDGVRKALIVQLMPDGLVFINDDGSRDSRADPVLNMPILQGGAAAHARAV